MEILLLVVGLMLAAVVDPEAADCVLIRLDLRTMLLD